MAAVAGRQLDAGHRRGIEARLVEHHDDVRRLDGRMAGLVRRRAKLIRRGGIEVDPAFGRKFIGRRHAGAHERRDVIDALELLPGLLRKCQRKAGDGNDASRRAQQRNRTRHAERIDAPDHDQQRRRDQDGNEHDDAKVRKDREQEGHGVRIDDQDIEEVDHHPENRKLELRQHNHEPDQAKRQRRRQLRAAAAARGRRN